jgi:hypothetical protein
VSKIGEAAAPRPVQNVSAASYVGAALASDSIVSAFGSSLATAVEVAATNPRSSLRALENACRAADLRTSAASPQR